MRKALFITGLLAFSLCQAAFLHQKIIRIGKFSYETKTSKVILKDEWYDCRWLTLYSMSGKPQAGLLVEGKRNDSLFVTGTYQIEANKFIVKTYYHYRHRHEPDSVVKVFVPNTKGQLELRSYLKFMDGTVKEVK